MTRIAIMVASVAAIAGLIFYAGGGWQRERNAQDDINTIERSKDAELSTGDEPADTDWLRERGGR